MKDQLVSLPVIDLLLDAPSRVVLGAPFFVWPLFFLLLFGGLRARKTSVVALKWLLIGPAILFGWSFYSMLKGPVLIGIALWLAAILLGLYLGELTVRSATIRVDRVKRRIEIPGSIWPLILSMAVFCLRFFLGVSYDIDPEVRGSWPFLLVETLATVVTGMFLGRLIVFWRRAKSAPHVNLARGR